MGSFHVAGRLGKPVDDVSAEMRKRIPGFTKTITPKSMRRMNKDLLRQEGVSQLVAQAINSHHNPKMHAHSTISKAEESQRVRESGPAVSRAARITDGVPYPTT